MMGLLMLAAIVMAVLWLSKVGNTYQERFQSANRYRHANSWIVFWLVIALIFGLLRHP